MTASKDMITIRANLRITAQTLETIVENAKKLTGRNEKGHYNVDTAELVNDLISRFILEYGFEEYVKKVENYQGIQ